MCPPKITYLPYRLYLKDKFYPQLLLQQKPEEAGERGFLVPLARQSFSPLFHSKHHSSVTQGLLVSPGEQILTTEHQKLFEKYHF